jgi:hypothetical protein
MNPDAIQRLTSPSECDVFERNAMERGRPDLATEARRRSIQLRAEAYGASTNAERECIAAIYAYERILTEKNGRTTRASRTWQMIDRHGIIQAVERAVNRPDETAGYTALVEKGLGQFAFEVVVTKYPELFSPEAVRRCKERIGDQR